MNIQQHNKLRIFLNEAVRLQYYELAIKLRNLYNDLKGEIVEEPVNSTNCIISKPCESEIIDKDYIINLYEKHKEFVDSIEITQLWPGESILKKNGVTIFNEPLTCWQHMEDFKKSFRKVF